MPRCPPAPDGATAEFDNTEACFCKLIARSGEGVECIAYEASGPYRRDLNQGLLQHGLRAACVNPWQARSFAQASGRRVKTDRVDAAMLASMAAAMPLRPTPPLSETQRNLQDLRQALQGRNSNTAKRKPLMSAPFNGRSFLEVEEFARYFNKVFTSLCLCL